MSVILKYAVGVEYCGSNYCGWQFQKHCRSVQGEVEKALSFVADHPVSLICAGRTDAGVHAVEQVVHFESSSKRDNRAWMLGSNCRLPKDIRLKWVCPVDSEFHARYSALARSYRYIILNTQTPSGLFSDRCCWEFRPLDQDAMHESAKSLLGEHDFSAFRAAGCQAKSANRNVKEIRVSRRNKMLYLDIKANAFLYHMVRNIAGSLMTVGKGEKPVNWVAEVLASGNRNLAAKTAPAGGLYFVKSWYPEQFILPHSELTPVLF
ncbi:MAG: tRNA pseudouridine38-40 synthase [Gammaproteobacteria bacterium]|jgi:tRNA pseudouridine38-40 synthase